MSSKIELDKTKLLIFHESRKNRIFVGELIYVKEKDRYELIYDENYTRLKKAIPISPKLDLFKLRHKSEKGKLFPAFIDRIPEKSNPAYEDYCKAQRISPKEKNQIVLLGSIGKRGPSSFVFEPVYKTEFSKKDILAFREELQISQQELAKAFDIKKLTLLKIETEKSMDANTLKLLQIYFQFPEVALWQLKQTGGRIHSDILNKLIKYFETQSNPTPPDQQIT